jgi:hypothetical protein
MAESVYMTNANPWFTGPLPGVGFISSSGFAAATRSISPLGWMLRGFGGATMGAATHTALETGIIAAASGVGNFAYATAAYEIGVGVGSAIDATYYCFGY